ncbi:phytanoyl-CoA dioxygenase family protein [bacterium]|nr:phytanoyl-CoA dioxygenase family protein [bacterium]MBU1958599.1 phytanoyl-CoA dioxygenase family protein [bacterium]
MELTPIQLNEFNVNGFLILRNFADKRACEAILDVAKVHLKYQIEPIETEIDYGGKSQEYRTTVTDYNSIQKDNGITIRRLRQVYHRDILFKNWMENEKIRPILKQVLHDDVVITTAHHNSIMTKMPFSSTETSWHRDRRYWAYEGDNLVSVWLALDEENSENGVLEFIPGSHKMQFSEDQFGEKEYFDTEHPKNKLLIKTKQSTVLHRGDVVIFHCKLLHRANENRTDKPKISFVYTVKGKQTKVIKGSRSAEYPEIFLDWS